MAYSTTEYTKMLLDLLPNGKIWHAARQSDGVLYNLLKAFAMEMNQLDLRVDDLKIERDTRTAYQLLKEHETDLALPDDCAQGSQTITERRFHAHSKFIEDGGLHEQSYVGLADEFGWTITTDYFSPFWCGIGRCGDSIGDQDALFYARINILIDADSWVYFTCGSSQCGDGLIKDIGTGILECIFNKYKPAHITLIWNYYGPEFTNAFSSAFSAMPSSDSSSIQLGAFYRAFGSAFDVYQLDADSLYEQFNRSFSTAFDVQYGYEAFSSAFGKGFSAIE